MKYFLLIVGGALVLRAAGIHDSGAAHSDALGVYACLGGMLIGSSLTLAFTQKVNG